MFARLPGATIGATTLRCSSCFGGSMAMNIASLYCVSWSSSVIPAAEENTWRIGLDLHDILVFGHRPDTGRTGCLGPVHRVVAPQPGEPVGPDIILKQPRVGHVDSVERHGPGIIQDLQLTGASINLPKKSQLQPTSALSLTSKVVTRHPSVQSVRRARRWTSPLPGVTFSGNSERSAPCSQPPP